MDGLPVEIKGHLQIFRAQCERGFSLTVPTACTSLKVLEDDNLTAVTAWLATFSVRTSKLRLF